MTSHASFDEKTNASEVAPLFKDQIKGKNVVITGVSPKTLGEAFCMAIAVQEPAILIIASRSAEKLFQVESNLKAVAPNTPVKIVILDLMSQDAINKTVKEINSLVDKIDVLVNNAGIMGQTRQWTAEKLEGQFGTNHVGPFLLTNLLIDKLRTAAKANPPGATRIINIASHASRLSPIRFHDYNMEGKDVPPEEAYPTQLPPAFSTPKDGYLGFIAYGQSKTANLLFTVSLAEKLKGTGIVSYAVHPGSIWTTLTRDLDPEGFDAFGKTSNFWKTPDQGASTIVVAAFDPALNEVQGMFLDNCQLSEAVAPYTTDPKIAESLWLLSEKLVKQEFKL